MSENPTNQHSKLANSQWLIEGMADGLAILDPKGKILLFNTALEKLTGRSEQEVLGRSTEDIFDPHTPDGLPFDLTDWDSHGSCQASVAIRTVDGRLWTGVTSAKSPSGNIILAFRDTTDQVELIQRQNEFVSIASHELRTPITALVGFLSLARTAEQPDLREKFLSRSHLAATRLSELVEDLLSVARIEEGRLQLTMEAHAPAELMTEVVESFETMAEGKGLKLTYRNALSTKDVVEADRSKLLQVFANLVDNAIKYTLSGGTVKVATKRVKQQIIVTVKDTGIGIDPKNLGRIFDKFFREYTDTSRLVGGTGLGLFITKELVERQGGKLEIDSARGRGTTAVVTLPTYAG